MLYLTPYRIFFLSLTLGIASLFSISAQTKGLNSSWQFSEDKISWETINIPHTWNSDDAFDDAAGYRRGLGYYKKQIFIAKEESDSILYLKFNAVNQTATVYVNGKKVGLHKGGYTAFSFNITSFVKLDANNLIEVTVDNSFNKDIPPLDADFTFYGGIYRDVELITVKKQHFSLKDFASDGYFVNYYNVTEEKAGVKVNMQIDNFATLKSKNHVYLKILDAQGNLVLKEHQRFQIDKHSSKTIDVTFPEIKNPKLWSPDNPYLYQLELVLTDENGHILDSKFSNLGFRWVSVDPEKGFFLNGKPLKLIGVNRHQDYEGFGNAVPMALQKKDIQLIKAMGSNVIRFAHYPHAKELYKLCDELGILVWSEVPIVNLVTNSEAFFETALTMQEEHLKQYYNYPSVVMFGYMNEIFLRLQFDKKMAPEDREKLKKDTYRLTEKLEALTRELAPNHITVMALHFNEIYNETKIANIPMLIGWNLYFGWYYDTIEDLGKFLDDQHRRFPNRSIMISEYGPGADVRISTQTPMTYDYSEEYQLKLHKSYYEQVKERPFVAGMTAWNFADFGSEFRGESQPHINQKGLVQYNRKPKEIYYWYQSVLQQETPILHIANYQKELTLFNKSPYEFTIFSNQKTGNVFLNDTIVEMVNFNSGVAKIKIPLNEGLQTLRIESQNTADTANFNVKKITNLKSNQIESLAINLGTHINFYDDASGLTFLADRPYKENLFGYDKNSGKCKRQLISNNIKNSHLEGVFQTILSDCGTYKVDVPHGKYKVTLLFVEPTLKRKEQIIFNLKYDIEDTKDNEHRIFNIYINETLVEKHFDMSQHYNDKYGITLETSILVKDEKGLTITLKPIEGEPVISGMIIEKLN
ncbi:glycoside hydrolase family 2 [Winogradskyella eckloniae]|uniref:glycoside hydrolase family 2 TIM barrel-domain containing protein n=1 Tax=Winogradskyella eckloniae TaxID=1089306 RepID=UPI001565DFB6|nr:glycoside hydrolase family 2 TIM barrel-domain containing protein [Winogradskyella eckloniae]NRD18633.1 glycoside hydrolase family 2 [Winogradskyella eckloniae]